MTDENGEPITAQPPQVQAAVNAVARARVTEMALVVVACVAAVGLIATTAWNTYRLRQLTSQQVKSQDFGLHAINCILDNFADHRWSNQVFHDNLAAYLKAPATPHVPLPVVPTDAQFAKDCAPFNQRTEQREGTGGPTVTSVDNTIYPTTTTGGMNHAPTTRR